MDQHLEIKEICKSRDQINDQTITNEQIKAAPPSCIEKSNECSIKVEEILFDTKDYNYDDLETILHTDYREYYSHNKPWGMSHVNFSFEINHDNADKIDKFMQDKSISFLVVLCHYKDASSNQLCKYVIMFSVSSCLLEKIRLHHVCDNIVASDKIVSKCLFCKCELVAEGCPLKKKGQRLDMCYTLFDVKNNSITREDWQPIFNDFLTKRSREIDSVLQCKTKVFI